MEVKLKEVVRDKTEEVLDKLHQAKENQLSPIDIARLEGQLDVLKLVDKVCLQRGRY